MLISKTTPFPAASSRCIAAHSGAMHPQLGSAYGGYYGNAEIHVGNSMVLLHYIVTVINLWFHGMVISTLGLT